MLHFHIHCQCHALCVVGLKRCITDRVNLAFDLRAHDLVPSEYAVDKQAAALEGAGAAEGVGEGGIGGEVGVDGRFLLPGRALDEGVDYGTDILNWVVHWM